jgi:hypothetical protein
MNNHPAFLLTKAFGQLEGRKSIGNLISSNRLHIRCQWWQMFFIAQLYHVPSQDFHDGMVSLSKEVKKNGNE